MKPLYVPKGKAKEYGDYAVNIYTGCPHRCYYCSGQKSLPLKRLHPLKR
jgi:DNA repair photolyase